MQFDVHQTLECIQVYAHTQVTAERLVSFLEVLSDLPKVTTLRVATARHPICLPSVHLQHVTSLELGVNVSFDVPPRRLCSLFLQDLKLDYEGYNAMLTGMRSSPDPLCVELNSFAPAALQSLPSKMHCLKLTQALDKYLVGSSSNMQALHTGLAKLSFLKILCIADSLTGRVVGLLSCLSFPQLHTLEICFSAFDIDEQHPDASSSTALVHITANLNPLQQVFPSLEHLRMCSFDSDHRSIVLDCRWINTYLFPKLLAVTFCCPHAKLQLDRFWQKSQFQVVHKCQPQQG